MAARKSHEYWPQDLLTPVLLRLPVKSIIRFRSVSKSWNSLPENPDFVSQQLSINRKNNNCFLVRHEHHDGNRQVLAKLFLGQAPPTTSYLNLLPENQLCVICAHDGLLCFWEMTGGSPCVCGHAADCKCVFLTSRITLCNPATREFRVLPECTENMPPLADSYDHAVGFGSNSLSNDYNVIYLRKYVDLETGIGSYAHAAVYRMGTDSWRVLEGEDVEAFRDLCVRSNCNNTFVNGVYYWVAQAGTNGDDLKVLTFQFDNEVFQLIDWPTIHDIRDLGSGGLLPLPSDRISLCLPDVTNGSFDVWMLNDEVQNWTKLLSIGGFSGVRDILGFRSKKSSKDDISKVFVHTVKGQLLLYDLETQKFEEVGIKSKEDSEDWSYLTLLGYNESLVHCIKK